jgi:antitoxin CptB
MDHNSPHATATLDAEGRRLLWRCRRGMKELDVLLERYARTVLPKASPEQRAQFARFLELPDPVLVDYLLGQPGRGEPAMGQGLPPEPELAQLVRRIIGAAP